MSVEMSWIVFITLAVCCFISMWIGYAMGYCAGFCDGWEYGEKARGE